MQHAERYARLVSKPGLRGGKLAEVGRQSGCEG